MTIGELAAAAQVGVETVRYYQRIGLLGVPPPAAVGWRRYDVQALRRLRFVKRAQSLGFTLEEIAALLALDGAAECHETRALAARKRTLIDAKLADLAAMRDALAAMIDRCDAEGRDGHCPIIDSLAGDESR